MTDSQLLDHFVAAGDEVAFRDLIARHGPMVLKVCRRVLHDPHDVEDSFQATFLVLIRRAPTIRDPESIGNWLYGVAYRIAVRSRRDATRRREHERQNAEMAATTDREHDHSRDDARRVIREELDRLPGSYRVPLELCYLRGMSHEEAAHELGWPLGTVKVRLVRGRRRLRERLDRRGVALGAGLFWLLMPEQAPAAVPRGLMESTVEAMLRGHGRETPIWEPGLARAVALADWAIRTGWKARRTWIILLALSFALSAAGGVALTERAWAGPDGDRMALPPSLTDILAVDCR